MADFGSSFDIRFQIEFRDSEYGYVIINEEVTICRVYTLQVHAFMQYTFVYSV